MYYISRYHCERYDITLVSDGEFLTGLYIENQGEYFLNNNEFTEKEVGVFSLAKEWLDVYFSGDIPNISVPIKLIGSEFRKDVWEELLKIPYGRTSTYGEIAKRVLKKRGRTRMSAQAVGNAIHNNPISIIVPCHRVIGSRGDLVGYNGGLDIKKWLLTKEKIMNKL